MLRAESRICASQESENPLYETVLTLAWSDSGRRKRDLRKSWASAGWRCSPFPLVLKRFFLRDAWQSRVSSAGITAVTGERTEQPNQRPSRCVQFTEKTETKKLLMNTVGAYWSLYCLMHEAQHVSTHTHTLSIQTGGVWHASVHWTVIKLARVTPCKIWSDLVYRHPDAGPAASCC